MQIIFMFWIAKKNQTWISLKKVFQKKNVCSAVIPSDDTKIIKFSQYQKSDKAPLIIYTDLVCLIEDIYGCKNNPENSSEANEAEYIPSGFSMSTISSFKSIENKHDVHGSKDFMKKFYESLTLFKMGLCGGCSRMDEAKRSLSPKSSRHILQWRNLAQLYLT